MYRVTIFLALIALCGCSQNQLEHQSDAFNRASATTISEQTLLNAVRSSLDLPMSFTKLQGYTAGGVAKGTLAPTSVVKAPRILGLGPTLDVSPGVETIQYVEVNNSGALAHLNKNLGYQDIHRYIVQGYDPWLIATILVEYVAIHDKLLTAVQAEAKRQCARPPNPVVKIHCDEVDRLRRLCTPHLPGSLDFWIIYNRARSKCDFTLFQIYQSLFFLAGYDTTLGFETASDRPKVERTGSGNVTITNILPNGKAPGAPKTTPKQVVQFSRPVQRTYTQLEKKFKQEAKRKGEKQKQPIEFVLRSPKSVLAYLGELIAMQNFSEDRYVPEIMVPGSLEAPIKSAARMKVFNVVREQTAGVVPALSIRGPDGKLYVVPRPEYGDYKRDQTLRVLTIASELVNGAISEKDFPAPASIIVRSVQ